ncbi:HAD family hydrolase [Intrasporangium mesophilum]
MIDPEADDRTPTAMFDFDGVLLRGDSTVSYLARTLRRSPRLLTRVAAPALAFATATRRANDEDVTRHAARVISLCLKGAGLRDVTESLKAEGVHLALTPERSCAPALSTLRSLRTEGVRVVVNTAAPDQLVRSWLATLDLADVPVVASTLAQGSNGVILARHNRGERKVRGASDAGYGSRWTFAFADSIADLPMLKRASQPFLVNPSRRTRAIVRDLVDEIIEVTW